MRSIWALALSTVVQSFTFRPLQHNVLPKPVAPLPAASLTSPSLSTGDAFAASVENAVKSKYVGPSALESPALDSN